MKDDPGFGQNLRNVAKLAGDPVSQSEGISPLAVAVLLMVLLSNKKKKHLRNCHVGNSLKHPIVATVTFHLTNNDAFGQK